MVLVFAKPRIRVLMLSGRRHQRRVTPTFFSPANAPKTVCRPKSKSSRHSRPKQTGTGRSWVECSSVHCVIAVPGVKVGGQDDGRGFCGSEAAPGTAVKMAIYHFVFKRGSGEREREEVLELLGTENRTKNQTKLNRTNWNEMKDGMWATYF